MLTECGWDINAFKMVEKHIMINLDDEKADRISEVLSSKVCKKILSLLAEKNLSESDIAKELKLPLNTVEYNLKKLINVGLVEKTKEHFWSKRGKKIPVYKASKKTIVISPKFKASGILKSVIIGFIVTGIISVFVRMYSIKQYAAITKARDELLMKGVETATGVAEGTIGTAEQAIFSAPMPIWLWFLAGSLVALLIVLILNWRRL